MGAGSERFDPSIAARRFRALNDQSRRAAMSTMVLLENMTRVEVHQAVEHAAGKLRRSLEKILERQREHG
jgi:hypothetical protein